MPGREITDFFAVALGLFPGATPVVAIGENPDVDIATVPETIWPGGGLYPWKPVATAMEVVSTSATDTVAGTGARTVLINGLNAAYVEISEVVALNGLTPVVLANQYLRINVCAVLTSGTNGVNAGDLSIRDAGAGTVRDILPAGSGISKKAAYTVPAGKTFYIASIMASVRSAVGVIQFSSFTGIIRDQFGNFRLTFEATVSSTVPYRHSLSSPTRIPEKTDIAIRTVEVSANNVVLSSLIEGILVTNNLVIF